MAYVAIKNHLTESDFESLVGRKDEIEINKFSWVYPEIKMFVPRDLACAVSSRIALIYRRNPEKKQFSLAEVLDHVAVDIKITFCCKSSQHPMKRFAMWICGYTFDENDETDYCPDHWRFGGVMESPRYKNAIMHYFFQNTFGHKNIKEKDLYAVLQGCISSKAMRIYWNNYTETGRKEQHILSFLLDAYAWIGLNKNEDECQVRALIGGGGDIACCLAGKMAETGSNRDKERCPWNRKNWSKYLFSVLAEDLLTGKRKRRLSEESVSSEEA